MSSVTSSSSASKKRTRVAGDVGNKKRAPVAQAKDLDAVLRKCRELKTALREQQDDDAPKVLPDSVKSQEIVEVSELSATEVMEGIEGVALNIARQVLAKKGFTLDVPSRSSTNQVYIKEWDRIVLGGKRSTRNFLNVRVSYRL
jgi:meiotic recombination protein SPO11